MGHGVGLQPADLERPLLAMRVRVEPFRQVVVLVEVLRGQKCHLYSIEAPRQKLNETLTFTVRSAMSTSLIIKGPMFPIALVLEVR